MVINMLNYAKCHHCKNYKVIDALKGKCKIDKQIKNIHNITCDNFVGNFRVIKVIFDENNKRMVIW